MYISMGKHRNKGGSTIGINIVLPWKFVWFIYLFISMGTYL